MLRKVTDLLLHPNPISSLAPQTITFPNRTTAPTFSIPPLLNLKYLCIKGQLKEALLEMAIQGLNVKFDGYDSVLTACINLRAFREGQRVHAHMIKTQYDPSVYLNTRLMVMYTKCGVLEGARQVLDGMSQRNIVSWTAMISAYAQRSHRSEALDLFVQMLETGMLPNEFTLATTLTACTGCCGLEHAIIAGYAQLGFDEEALQLFRQLQKEGMESNYVTYTSVLTALSGIAALDYGQQAHTRIIRSELPSYVVLQNSLIDMYSKCGSLTYSRRVFDSMSERTVISWNAMLVGYGKHGLGRQVLELFKLMQGQEVKPDNITFMAVLSGCSHGGLVEEGLNMFNSMIHNQDVEPEIEHYGCVVDLLGRAGQVDRALSFINQMPFEPTAAIWGSLLGACRVHINVPVGEYVAQRLFEIEPQNAGNYVILSNIFAAAGRWEDVVNMRQLMKDKTVMKEPGRSWIKMDRILHTFHVGDRFHPKREEISIRIRELSAKIKEAGYIPDLSCVLHDVDDEQKERILLSHSEKLAMTFGLMSLPPAMPIRIVKNLRVCVDCHNFAKFVSKVCEREITLRDSNRFHHIVGGICSCRDYW